MFFIILIVVILLLLLLINTIFQRNAIAKRVLNDVKNNISKTSKILDIGAGKGEIRNKLKSNGYNDIISIDVEGSGNNKDIEIYDGHKIPYEDNYFDSCICVYVLHHVLHSKELLAEMRRVCKYNAILLLYEDIPPKNYLQQIQSEVHYSYFKQPKTMVAKGTLIPDKWVDYMKSTGWEPMDEQKYSGNIIYTLEHIRWIAKAV
jgi:ubiquinone/menaquinone biosynthesis C-methylase UbiE